MVIYQGCKELSYEEKLEWCDLTILDKRRSRGDLSEACKIIVKLSVISPEELRYQVGYFLYRNGIKIMNCVRCQKCFLSLAAHFQLICHKYLVLIDHF